MKALWMLPLLFVAVNSQAAPRWLDISARYTCQTDHVLLRTAEGNYLNLTPNTTVVYEPKETENQNLVIGNYGYVIWIRQLSDTEMGFTLMKNIKGELKTTDTFTFNEGKASIEMDFPLNNPGGEGGAHCKIELSSKPSKKFQ